MAAAVTELRTTTPNDCVSKSRRITSSAKKTPAIGALNVAEIPPAAPHATSSGRRLADTRATCPVTEPIADPICTIGPSRPTDPPDPMHSAEASALTIGTCGRMRPAALGDREHDLGDAVPARLGREARRRAGRRAGRPTTGATSRNQIPSPGTCGLATRPASL